MVDGFPYNEAALRHKGAGRPAQELQALLDGVVAGADTPYTYDRAALLLEKQGEPERALEVCVAWDRVVSPSASESRVAAIGKRRARLQARLGR